VAVSEYPLFEYPPYELVLASKMVDVAKYEGLDLVHVHYAIPHASAAIMARQILEEEGISLPVITTLHGTDITLLGKDASFEPVITYAINESDAVTAVSDSLRKDTYSQLRNVKINVEVIPNFVCLDSMKSNIDEDMRLVYAPKGQKILCHISNFRPVKRVDDVVRVFAEVRKQIPCKLLLVGDGPERHKIENLCRQLHTCDDVIMLGKLKNPTEVLFISDLFLLTSEIESFGLAALEAMACKVPVISTNTGGIPEVNLQGITGFLSDVGNVEEMAKNAIYILSDEKRLEQFREQAYNQAKEFEISKILPMYESLYERVLTANRKNK
jgi:N-acetyl-alpha-D-glucosaminyl L-malate synthase BshA